MKLRPAALAPLVLALLAACGGGGGGSSSTIPANQVGVGNTATTQPINGVTPGSSASPGTAVSPIVVPTAGPAGTPIPLSTAAAKYYDTGATIGTATPFPDANLPAPGNGGSVADIDHLFFSYNMPQDETHFHTHISLFVDGVQAQMPWGIGMVGTLAPALASTDGVGYAIPGAVLGGSAGTFALHTHDHSGIIHVEDIQPPSVAQSWTLGDLFDVWGQTSYLDSLHFTQYLPAEPVHIYVTSNWLDAKAVPVEYFGDFRNIQLLPLEEITVEVGNTFVPIPRYDFAGYFCPNTIPDPADKNPTDKVAGGFTYSATCFNTELTPDSAARAPKF